MRRFLGVIYTVIAAVILLAVAHQFLNPALRAYFLKRKMASQNEK